MQSLNWPRALACLISGALLVLSFAPFEVYPLAFVCLAVLFYCWQELSPRASFWAGLIFAYGVYGVGVSWVYVSLSTYGGMPLWMGSIAVLGFVGLLAIFIALTGWSAAKFFPNQRILALPFLWVIFEWMKSWVLTGFPWLDLGYTQTPSWLFAFAPLGGVYLVSFTVALIAALLVYALRERRLVLPSLLLAMLIFSAYALDKVSWSKPTGAALVVGLVQPNTPIEKKWQSSYRDGLLQRLAEASYQLKTQHAAELIVWPETALPLYLQQTDQTFWQAMVPPKTALITGIVDSPSLPNGSYEESYNAAVLLCNGEPQRYRKRHLVPFGEYLPLRFLFNWVLVYLDLPMSDFSSWRGTQKLECGEQIKIGLSICYEDAFAAEYRAHVGDATLLVNISEDAWFGDSFAPHQRLQMAQMRARELARPLLRSANSGPSVVIDQEGQLLASTAQFEADILSYKVQPQTGETPFKRWGNWIIWLLAGCLVLGYWWRRLSLRGSAN